MHAAEFHGNIALKFRALSHFFVIVRRRDRAERARSGAYIGSSSAQEYFPVFSAQNIMRYI